MAENSLENITGQEIKELIENEIVSLQELDNSALEKVLAFESEMLCHGTGDMNLIRQCSEILDSRSNSDKLNHGEISEIIDKTKSEHITIVSTDNNRSAVSSRRKPRYVLKRIAIVAAAILVMLTSTVAIAGAFGVDLLDYISKIVRQDKGSVIVAGDFTFCNAGESRKYSTFEEMLEKENLDILYPTKLPEGVYIKKVYAFDDTIAEKNVSVTTTDESILISISVQYKEVFVVDRPDEVLTVNGIEFFIMGDYAMCYHKGNYYSIKADNYDDLILIIKNLKE